MTQVEVGNVFGCLTVRRLDRGAKRVHPVALCECSCGRSRVVRLSHLRRGLAASCAHCAWRAAWRRRPRNDESERRLLEAESTYRCNARRRPIKWELTREEFRALVLAGCHYCGTDRAGGIDRLDSTGGYIKGNVVPCCAPCNYAKRLMTVAEFLAWVRRVCAHQAVKP